MTHETDSERRIKFSNGLLNRIRNFTSIILCTHKSGFTNINVLPFMEYQLVESN